MPRLAAWQLLRSSAPTPLREVDAIARARDLSPRDRAFLRRLVGTEIRRRGSLRALVRHFVHRKPSADLAAHLHLGLVQAFFLDRVPDHALVSETLRAVHASMGPSKVRVVNAVLRTALRARVEGASGDPRRDLVGRDLHLVDPVFRDPGEHPLLWAEDALSLPAQLARGWVARFGQEAAFALGRQALDEPPLSLRVRAPSSREELAAALAADGVAPRPGAHPAFLLAPPGETELVVQGAAFAAGRLSVQGQSAYAAGAALEARPGERLLDLCAAPGGKTVVLAESGAEVVACDVNAARLERVAEALARLGLAERVRLVESDGTAALDAALGDGALFDGVLIDAPCTNTGVLAARPEARWRFGPAQKSELVALQKRLLREGAERVRPGGRLVWSTCSLEPDENRQQVDGFLGEHPGWTLEADALTLPDTATTADGGAGPIDGGYHARLRRAV